MDVKDSVLIIRREEGKPLKIGESAAIVGINKKKTDTAVKNLKARVCRIA